MKKLFIQFYLLLFVCFLVMSLLVGLVYKFTAERAGKQSLDDLMNSSLYLMRNDLAMGISMSVSTLMRVRALNDLVSHLTRWRTISTP